MVKRKVLNNLKSGSTNELDITYLEHIGISDFDWKNEPDLLFQWNVLHKPKLDKTRNFTFVQKGTDLFTAKLNRLVETLPKYAYIKHNMDATDGDHWHYYIEYPNPRSFVSVANDLGIPVTSLQKVLNKRGILQYLTHENEPNKHHYSKDSIVSNMNITEEIQENKIDVMQVAHDYYDMRQGKMTYFQFIERHKTHISRLSFSGIIQVLDKAYKAEDLGTGNLSPFRVPSSNPPP